MSRLAIYGTGRVKIHRPRNEPGYLHQSDQTVAQAACGCRVRLARAEGVDRWLTTPWLLCAKCWPAEVVANLGGSAMERWVRR